MSCALAFCRPIGSTRRPLPYAARGCGALTWCSFYKEGVRAVGIQRVIDEAGIAKASL
jgi:hypothetical protein